MGQNINTGNTQATVQGNITAETNGVYVLSNDNLDVTASDTTINSTTMTNFYERTILNFNSNTTNARIKTIGAAGSSSTAEIGVYRNGVLITGTDATLTSTTPVTNYFDIEVLKDDVISIKMRRASGVVACVLKAGSGFVGKNESETLGLETI